HIVKEEGKIGIQSKQGTGEEPVDLQRVPELPLQPIVNSEHAAADPSAIVGVDKPETVEPARRNFVQGQLSRRKETVASEVQLEAHALARIQAQCGVARDVVARIAERIPEGTVRARSLVGDKRIGFLRIGTKGE